MSKKIKDLQSQLNIHYSAMKLARDNNLDDGTVWSFHKLESDKLRLVLLDKYKELDKRQPPKAVRIARDSRWRHFGAIGSIQWAIGTLSGLSTLPTASDAARQLAQRIVNDLWTLKQLMGTKQ